MYLDGRGGGEELGEVEGGEAIIRTYYMRKKSIFNKREININNVKRYPKSSLLNKEISSVDAHTWRGSLSRRRNVALSSLTSSEVQVSEDLNYGF